MTGRSGRPAVKPKEDTSSVIDNTNRRESDRVQATFQVRYNTLDSLVSAYTENISKGGIYIRTESLLPQNAMVRVKLAMPENGPEIECIGQVARVHSQKSGSSIPTGMAVVFRDMSEEHRQFIEDYISDLTTRKLKEPSSVPPRCLSILVVDDDATVRRNAAEVLKKQGHRVETAEDGLKALARCLQDPPDVIVTDVQMPRMDGWNLLKTIRTRASLAATLVIFQTSLKDEKDRLLGYQLGVDDYLAKPYTARQLVTSVNKLVQRSRTNVSLQSRAKALRGDIEQVSIPTVLSLLEMEKKTGILIVVGKAICLFTKEGRPVDIEIEGMLVAGHMDMVTMLLSWKQGQFEFAPQDVPDVDRIRMTMQGMLLEAARLHDETGVITTEKKLKKKA